MKNIRQCRRPRATFQLAGSAADCFCVPRQLLRSAVYIQASNPFKDKLLGFCHALLRCSVFGSPRPVQISHLAIAAFAGERGLKKVRAELVQAQVITCDEKYSYRHSSYRKCLSYSFSSTITADDFVSQQPHTHQGAERLQARARQTRPPSDQRSNHTLPVHGWLHDKLAGFKLDRTAAMDFCDDLPAVQQVPVRCQIEKIIAGQFFSVVCETQRFYTNFTNLKKELRSHLTWNGESLCEIDVQCCQPLLLNILMQSVATASDVQLHKQLTESGQLYERICRGSQFNRADIKEALLKYLCGPWFEVEPCVPAGLKTTSEKKRHACLKHVAKWYQKKLPTVADFLKAEKTNTDYYRRFNTKQRRLSGLPNQPYVIISHELQQQEAGVVIESCCGQLMDDEPDIGILTIHDALLVPISRQSVAEQHLKRSFAAKLLTPKISTKYL